MDKWVELYTTFFVIFFHQNFWHFFPTAAFFNSSIHLPFQEANDHGPQPYFFEKLKALHSATLLKPHGCILTRFWWQKPALALLVFLELRDDITIPEKLVSWPAPFTAWYEMCQPMGSVSRSWEIMHLVVSVCPPAPLITTEHKLLNTLSPSIKSLHPLTRQSAMGDT